MSNKKIVGYYDYLVDEYKYSRVNGEKRVDKPANDIARFFSQEDICPFCKTTLVNSFKGRKSGVMGRDIHYSGDVLECPNCSWWMYKTRFSEESDEIDTVSGVYTDTKYYGISHSFDVDDNDLPIHVLNTELSKRPQLLYQITPRKLEELAQDILRGIYYCEVKHVGQTGDGGKDLIVLHSDAPILVQVKQRQNMERVELVKGIREFVGTMYIEDVKKGIYVSTAKRFSKGSRTTVQRLLDSRKLDYFELINYDRLCELIAQKNLRNRGRS